MHWFEQKKPKGILTQANMKLKTCNCRTQVAFTELYLAGILRYPGKDLSIIKYAHFYSIAHAAPAGLNKP